MNGSFSRIRLGSPWIVAAALTIAAGLCYADSLAAPFIFDDVDAIVTNPPLRSLLPDARWWSTPQSPLSGRPAVAFSFALNYAVGGLDPRGYRLVNIVLHIAAACVLAGWIRRTVAESPVLSRYADRADAWAAVIALLWIVYPLNTETVAYVTQRTELSASLCYLLVMAAATRAWGSSSRLWPITAVAACWIGTACKEIVVTAPIVLALFDQAFFAAAWHAARRSRLWLYAGLASSWLLFLFLQGMSPRSETVGFQLGVAWWEYLFVQAGVLLHYLRLVVVPSPLCGDYGDFSAVGWCGPYIVPGLFVIGGLLLTTVGAWRRDRRWAFLGAWFFLILAPSSSIVPIISEPAAERRMYLPLIACLTALVVGGDLLLTKWTSPAWTRRLGLAAALLSAMVLGGTTVLRLRDYRSGEIFWQDAVVKQPNNPRAITNLGGIYLDARQLEASATLFRLAIVLNPDFAAAHNKLGLYYLAVGRHTEAAAEFREAIRCSPLKAEARANLGITLERLGLREEAVDELRLAVYYQKDNLAAQTNLGNALARSGRLGEALKHLTRAVEIDPQNVTAQANLAQVRADLKQGPNSPSPRTSAR